MSIDPRSGLLKVTGGFGWRKTAEQSAIFVILVILVVIAAVASPVFLKERNISNVVRQASILGIVATGQLFVILTGGIDLSVASIIAFMSILSAGLMNGRNEMVYPVALACLGISLLIGLANGLLVTKLRIPAFIATLGMVLILQGIRFLYSGGMPKGSIPDGLLFFGSASFLWIPLTVWICLAVGAISAVILQSMTLGRSIYAVGGNLRTAYMSGINTDRVQIIAYMSSSFWAGFTGLLLTGWVGMADNWLGRGYDLNSIAAVVIGGAVLTGGKGNVWGTLAGACMIALLFNIVVLLGLDADAQRIVRGLVIIVAVGLYVRLSTRR
jgi:ribose/xylose/arabinose/galactoside ABC-type transport system permease subunit